LIEIDRSFHQHWALFLGEGYVINLTPVGKSKKRAQTLRVHIVPQFIRKVKKQPLKEVVGNNKWCINNKSDQDSTPLPEEEIIRHAEGLIDMEMTYHGFGSNCERFVKRLRYGEQVSD
ncbi:HRSL1 enzyme, partial [Origma solitaria]|nr:HRSL1 enzyme [Origma solitaria]